MGRTPKATQNAVNGSVVNGTARSSAIATDSKLNGHAYHIELLDQKTDYARWRLLDEEGRHTWHYLTTDEQVKAWPQTIADKYHLGLPIVRWPTHFRENSR
jgi:hypothetical protein